MDRTRTRQAARLTLAEARAQDAIRRVQELDPNWRVQLGTYKTAEGEIRALEAEAERAEARIRELTRAEPPIVPTRRPPTAHERNAIIKEIGRWLLRNRLPRMKHWEITGWFGRENKRYGGLSPREYLRGKGWDERVRVGREALIEQGVLKP